MILRGFMSFSCSLGSRNVLLFKEIFNKLINTDTVRDLEMFSLPAYGEKEVYYITFTCNKKVCMGDLLGCVGVARFKCDLNNLGVSESERAYSISVGYCNSETFEVKGVLGKCNLGKSVLLTTPVDFTLSTLALLQQKVSYGTTVQEVLSGYEHLKTDRATDDSETYLVDEIKSIRSIISSLNLDYLRESAQKDVLTRIVKLGVLGKTQ